jgi:hypothetical protein
MEAVSVAEREVIVKLRSRAEKNRFTRNSQYAVRIGNLNSKMNVFDAGVVKAGTRYSTGGA